MWISRQVEAKRDESRDRWKAEVDTNQGEVGGKLK